MVVPPLTERGNCITSRRLGKVDGRAEGASMNFDNTESIDGYAIPVDPMDLLQCDSCQ